MESKYFAIFALVFVVASVFISRTESTPVASELESQVNTMNSMAAPADNMMVPKGKGQRKGRFYGYGYPYGGYGGMGGYGGSSASAAAAASASSGGMGYGGYPYGRK